MKCTNCHWRDKCDGQLRIVALVRYMKKVYFPNNEAAAIEAIIEKC